MSAPAHLIPALATSRSRAVMRRIAEGLHARMPCGDQRIAHSLWQRGLLTLVDPKHREFTTSYRPTEDGMAVLLHHIPDFERP